MGEKRNRNIWRIINLLSETQIEGTDIIKRETETEREREREREREK